MKIPKEDDMAGTFDGDWESKINNVSDGIITVRPPTLGLFDGTHRNTNRGLVGEATDGAVPHISFVRMESRCIYFYDGDIRPVPTPTPHFEIFNGTVTKICRRTGDRVTNLTSLFDDEWTAEKPT
jgi:hypothetical protein